MVDLTPPRHIPTLPIEPIPGGYGERQVWGHEDAFLRPRLNARCPFGYGTFAGTHGNGREAPKAVVSAILDWSPRGAAKRQINR